MDGSTGRTLHAVVADDVARVRVERRGPVATVVLDSPANRNALSARLLGELVAALREIQADPDVRAVVLTGTGTVFSSGADLHEHRGHHTPEEPGSALLPELLSLITALPQPVVARVNGHVRGGGVGLVAASDLAVAPRPVTFAFSEVRVGVAPAMIAVPALAVMGRRSFSRYALTGEPFGADAAVTAGLLTAAVDPDDLDGWVAGAVAAVLRSSPQAVTATKGLIATVTELGWDEAMAGATALSAQMFSSEAAAEGMAAFLEKRPAPWVVEE